ncbi:MAG: hypothetical protein H0T05_01730 [Acidobacteria bacterium]|nr:hypothetical protein [Acidobacteriota bacterium]MBA3884738.1 hypothetical protein [Acidobacteriota bacterium]
MIKPRLLPSVTVAFSLVLVVVLFNALGLKPDDPGDGGTVYSISGRAIAAHGTLPANLWVRISWEEGRGVRSVSVPVRPDGTFVAEKLRPGDYRLAPDVRGDAAPPIEGTPAAVTIRDRDVTGIEIRM